MTKGPILLPCGTPPLIYAGSENVFTTFVTCDLPWRYGPSQASNAGLTPIFSKFWSNLLWSIRSNAFRKSRKIILTTFPWFSIAEYQLCARRTSAKTAEEPGSPPNWASLTFPFISSCTHSTTYDSWTLDRTLVREIGRRSSTFEQGVIFGITQTV